MVLHCWNMPFFRISTGKGGEVHSNDTLLYGMLFFCLYIYISIPTVCHKPQWPAELCNRNVCSEWLWLWIPGRVDLSFIHFDILRIWNLVAFPWMLADDWQSVCPVTWLWVLDLVYTMSGCPGWESVASQEAIMGQETWTLPWASEADCHCKPSLVNALYLHWNHKLAKQMPGCSRQPVFRWQPCLVGTWSTHPQSTWAISSAHNKPSLSLGTESLKSDGKTNQLMLPRGKCSVSFLVVKQSEPGSAVLSELVTGQCQSDFV